MNLQAFFPYRMAVLADAVSRSMAQVYAQRFDLSRDEWRVLVALAQGQPGATLKTAQVIEHTTLDKMQVSRAVKRMERDGLLARSGDPDDGRGHRLALTAAGRALFERIVPVVQARADFLLDSLPADERRALDAAMDKILARALHLAELPPEPDSPAR